MYPRCNSNDRKKGEKTHGGRMLQLIVPQGMLGGILLDNTHVMPSIVQGNFEP